MASRGWSDGNCHVGLLFTLQFRSASSKDAGDSPSVKTKISTVICSGAERAQRPSLNADLNAINNSPIASSNGITRSSPGEISRAHPSCSLSPMIAASQLIVDTLLVRAVTR